MILATVLACLAAGPAMADTQQADPAAEATGGADSPTVGRIDKVALEGMEKHPWAKRAWFHLAVPKDYSAEKAWPLFVVLHGGPNGSPDQIVSYFRGGLMSQGGISVYPNALVNQLLDWNYPHSGQYILSIIQQVARTYNVDTRRIYLTGVSMGGGGSWVQGALLKDVFAAIGPISGWYGASQSPDVKLLKDMPIYAMHGKKDRAVPSTRSRMALGQLKAIGRKTAVFTDEPSNEDLTGQDCILREIQEAGHNCFEPWKKRGSVELGRMTGWMLAQKRDEPADFEAAGKLLAAHGQRFGWKPVGSPIGQFVRQPRQESSSRRSNGNVAGLPEAPPVSEAEAKRIEKLVADLDSQELTDIMSAHSQLMAIGVPAIRPMIAMARQSRSRTTRVRVLMMIREIIKRSKEDPPPETVDKQAKWTEPVEGIAMRLSLDRDAYKPEQLVWLRVDFKNIDDKKRPFAPLTRLNLPRASGGKIEASFLSDNPDAAPRQARQAEYKEHPLLMQLEPGQVVTYRFRLNEKLGMQYKVMLMHDMINNQRAGLPLADITSIDWLFPPGKTNLRVTYYAASRGLLKGADSDLSAVVTVNVEAPQGAKDTTADPQQQTRQEKQAGNRQPAPDDTPVELGRIPWLRDFEAAKAEAARSGKPLLVLFDEIPGCNGCKKFGREMLSHPLVADAAREAFVPVAIRNNSKGDADAKLVKQFGMPAWAYPEVRLLAADNPGPKGDLVAREPKGWQKTVLPMRMAAALKQAGRDVPPYLALLTEELQGDSLQTACFWMTCYWTGEANLGKLDGVKAMRIGWLNKKEVVEVDFDPEVVSFEKLAKTARESCGSKVGVFARSEQQLQIARQLDMPAKSSNAPAKTDDVRQKRLLMVRQPEIWFLALTELQATRLNAALAKRVSQDEIDALLSPTQRAQRDRLRRLGRQMELVSKLNKEIGIPDRGFTGAAAWQRNLDAYLKDK